MSPSVGRVQWSAGDVDILDPRSRHNLHVTRAADLEPAGEWSRETLYAAVRFADGEDGVVVMDYQRGELYIADGADLTYDPPRRLGLAAPPALHVAAPQRFQPATATATSVDSVTVSPTFDVLVPAFDWDELDEDDMLLPPGVRASESPTGTGTGTPGSATHRFGGGLVSGFPFNLSGNRGAHTPPTDGREPSRLLSR